MAIIIKSADEPKENNASSQEPERTEAPSFSSLFRDFSTGGSLSSSATAYIDEIRKTLEDPASQHKIKMLKLTTPTGAVVFKLNNTGVILVFSEGVMGIEPGMPTSIVNADAIAEAKRIIGATFDVAVVVIVDPLSYNRAIQMAAYISQVLRCKNSSLAQNLRLESMAQTQYGLDTDINTVKQFVIANSPHSVPSRGDIGLVITMKRQDKMIGHTYDRNSVKDRYEPIIGILGYVELLQRQSLGGLPRFLPVIHITDIYSPIPDEKLLPIALATASDVFIGKQHWKNQFSMFDKEFPNIGNLIKDEQGAPWFAESVRDREDFINQCVDKPMLCIDITEGRARIPGIEKYANPAAGPTIAQEYTEFLGVQIPGNIQPAQLSYVEMVGSIEKGAATIDSRNVDYLSTVKFAKNDERINALLTRYPDPSVRSNFIQAYFPEVKWLYVNYVVALNHQLVAAIGREVNSKLKMRANFASLNGIDMSWMDAQSQAYAEQPISVIGPHNYGGPVGWWDNLGYNR